MLPQNLNSRLTRISVFTHCNDLGGKVWNPAIRWTKKYAVFVVIEDDEGIEGLGECWCFDSAPDTLVAFLRTEVVPHLIGTSIEDAFSICQSLITKATLTARHGILASALSGVDIALWDLLAQHKNRPLWQCLSTGGTGDVPLYASGGLYGEGKSTQHLADEMAGLAQQGFQSSKMKIGAESQQHDLARIRAVLDALPENTKLIIDGVYSYTADEAHRMFDALPEHRIEAFQSPTRANDYAGMAALARAGIPVMATEAEYRSELHEQLVHDIGVRFLQTAPIACGGISRVQHLAEMVRGTSTELSLEVSSTAVALMAACQLAAAETMIAHVEYHTIHSVFFGQIPLLRPQPNQNRCKLQDTTGLGLQLQKAEVQLVY